MERRAPRRVVRRCNPAERRARAGQSKKSGPATQATDAASPPAEGEQKSEKPADQAGDIEKPKAILDTSQEAPKTDSLGHVHFGSPNAEGLGRVAVKAAPERRSRSSWKDVISGPRR